MATLRINLEHLKETQGGRSIEDFAKEVGVHRSTMSRVLDGKTKTAGDRLIAGMLLKFPHTFPYYFEVVGDDGE